MIVGNIDISGDINVNAASTATLTLNAFGNISGTGNISNVRSIIFNVSGSNATGTLSGNITGASTSVNKTGSATSTLILSGTGNTYGGGTTVDAGTLEIDGSLGTAGVYAGTINVGNATTQANLTFGSASNINLTGTINVLNASSAITQNGNGCLTITSSLAGYKGFLNITSGTLALKNNGDFNNASGLDLSGGTLDATAITLTSLNLQTLSGNSISTPGSLVLGTKNLALSAVTDDLYDGSISGTGLVNITGTGGYTLAGASTFSGTLKFDVAGQTLTLDDPLALQNAKLNLANGSLDILQSTQLRSLLGGATTNVVLNANTLTLANASDSFAGNIS
ncbi:MAG: hypothetical protein EBT83_19045, partial [Betaproteobacteria bacterium]|nr:hypothetical protein [Betaproteobacteria bacterium]